MMIVYSIVAGFVILVITFALEAQLQSEEELGLKIWTELSEINTCGDDSQCVNYHKTILSKLNYTLELRQKQNSALWTGKIFGGLLIVGVPLLLIVGKIQ